MPGPAVPEGLFCDHRKLRTTCPECRPPPAAPVAKSKPRSQAQVDAEEDERRGESTRSPRSKSRRRVKAPTRQEAEGAEAWWVKGG